MSSPESSRQLYKLAALYSFLRYKYQEYYFIYYILDTAHPLKICYILVVTHLGRGA
jgi:hypothetical protein